MLGSVCIPWSAIREHWCLDPGKALPFPWVWALRSLSWLVMPTTHIHQDLVHLLHIHSGFPSLPIIVWLTLNTNMGHLLVDLLANRRLTRSCSALAVWSFSWGGVNEHLFILDRTLMTNQPLAS